MIIVEGPDGSGKDTLIANLGLQSVKLKALRGGVGGTDTYDNGNGLGDGTAGWAGKDPALLAYIKKMQAAAGMSIAFNRFHLSEVVYGPLLRGVQELEQGELDLLNNALRSHRVPVILCLPSFEVTMRNVQQPGRERPKYQTDEFLKDAYAGFQALAPYATVVYDFTRDAVPAV